MAPDDLLGLRKLYLGFMAARVVLTGNNLGVFGNLRKLSSPAEIARRLNTDLRPTEILLDALAGIGRRGQDRPSCPAWL